MTLHVTAPTRRHKRADLRLHFASLPDDDRAVRERIPVTTVSRTLLDLAATFGPDRLERAVERAEELRVFDLGAVDALLSRAGGHLGAGRLRRALTIYRDEPAFTRSRYELDAYWPRERFAVELDVYATHGSRAACERDRLRQEDLKLRGIEMIRVTGARLDREPHKVMERIGVLLRQRRRQLGTKPRVAATPTASSRPPRV